MHKKLMLQQLNFYLFCIICLVFFLKYVCILAMSFGYVRFAMYCVG